MSVQSGTGNVMNINKNLKLTEIIENRIENRTENFNPLKFPEMPNGAYIHRIELEDRMDKQFRLPTSSTVLSAYNGVGGVGKTYLAILAINSDTAEINFSERRYWFSNSDSKYLLIQQFITFSKQLTNFNKNDSIEVSIQKVINFLEEGSQFLIVFDNVSSLNDITEYLPLKGGHILITTRENYWKNSINVNLLTFKEAITFIEKLLLNNSNYNKPEDIENIKLLAFEMGLLPLAIKQACISIKNKGISILEFLEFNNQTLTMISRRNLEFFYRDIRADEIKKLV